MNADNGVTMIKRIKADKSDKSKCGSLYCAIDDEIKAGSPSGMTTRKTTATTIAMANATATATATAKCKMQNAKCKMQNAIATAMATSLLCGCVKRQ